MNRIKRLIGGIGGDKLILMAAIIVVFALFTSLNRNFLTPTNITNILVATSLVGLVAIGETYLVIAGHVDLSPGSLVALSGVLAALLVSKGVAFFPALLITLFAGAAVGLANSLMTSKIKLEPFIATLVTQSIVRGFAYILCGGKPVAISDATFLRVSRLRFPVFLNEGSKLSFSGIPLAVWIMIAAFALFGFILARTKFGRSIYAVGGNKDAARLAGLNPQRIMLVCYVMMGVICAVGGVVFAARMNSGQPAANVNLEFDAITAVILGGVSFSGGVGSMGGTILGVILIQSFNTGLTMVNVQSFWQLVARGGLLLFALTSDYIRKANREKNLLADSKRNS
ncbi:MAG: ABC transporter permease [Synergistaceae bacterium]|jgi:ribose/xylose/arabinose/galactoside ABC-type transport system permease subunit|nr:ABC transporter permease [Synergistaceae bacterium]